MRLYTAVGAVLVLSLVLGAVAGPARASLMDFEDLYPGQSPIPAGYGGFSWTGEAWQTAKDIHPEGSGFHETIQGSVGLFTGYQQPFSLSLTTGTFTFNGAHIGGGFSTTHAPVIFTGSAGGTERYTRHLAAAWNGEDFYDFGWSGIDTLTVTPDTTNPDHSVDYVTLDNLRFNESPSAVPEPASCALLVCAVGGLAAMARKRGARPTREGG